MLGSGQELEAGKTETRKAELDADAKVHENYYQQANELLQQTLDNIRDVKEKLSAIQQSRLETNRGVARNII